MKVTCFEIADPRVARGCCSDAKSDLWSNRFGAIHISLANNRFRLPTLRLQVYKLLLTLGCLSLESQGYNRRRRQMGF